MTRRQKLEPAAAHTADLIEVLVPVAFATMAALSRVGAAHDLSLTAFRALGILWDRRPRMATLADYLGLEKQTLSGLIARMEARGLVARAANPVDARATDVFLTKEGRKLMKELRVRVQQDLAPLTDGLSASDQQRLRDLLQGMLENWKR